MTLRERLFGPSAQQRMEAMLKDSLAQNAALQAQMLQTNALLGETIAQQGKTFTAYFAAATVAETPQVRPMDDWTEAGLEKRRVEERLANPSSLDTLNITPNNIAREMDAFFADIRHEFGDMS